MNYIKGFKHRYLIIHVRCYNVNVVKITFVLMKIQDMRKAMLVDHYL
jgi:hypothetical protein